MRRPPASAEAALRAVRRHLRSRGALLAGLALACVAGGVLLLAWLVGGGGWRPGSLLPAALLVLGGAGVLAGGALLVRYLRRWTDEPRLAGEVERSAGLDAGALRARLELARELPDGVSGSLVRAGERDLLPRLSAAPGALAGRPGREVGRLLRGTASAAGGLALVLLVLTGLAPDRSRVAWSGLADPAGIVAAGAPAPLGLEPGDVSLPRGTVPEIRVTAPGRDAVVLHWQAVGEPAREVELAVEGGVAEGTLPPLEAPVRYRATAPDGASTPEARIEPSDPLLLAGLVLVTTYPAYTGLAPDTLRGSPSSLDVPEGSRIAVAGRLEGDGSEVLLRDEEGASLLRAAVRGGGFEGGWRPVASGEVSWEVAGAGGGAALPDPIDLTVVPDRPPVVALPVPGSDGELPPSFRLSLLLQASDDHGLEEVEIEAIRVRRDGVREEPVRDRIPADGSRRVEARPVLDLAEWGLRPGEEILLAARATERSPRARTTRSREYRLRVPTAAALREAARERVGEASERVGSIAERADRQAGSLRDRARELRAGGRPADAEALRELQEAMEEERTIGRDLDEVRESLDDARRGLAGVGAEDAGLRERLRELSSLVNELREGTGDGGLEDPGARVRSGSDPDAAGEMEGLAESREALAERLEAAVERLRDEALEQDLGGTEEELRSLAGAQEAMSERMESEAGAAAQDSLAARARELDERLDELSGELAQRGESAAAERMEAVSDRVEESRERMETASERSRAGESEEAREQAESAAERAREALREMEEARSEREEQREDGTRDALRRGAEDALSLARGQEELRDRIAAREDEGREADEELRGDAGALVEGARNLVDRLSDAIDAAPRGEELAGALTNALGAMDEAVEALRGPDGEEAGEAAARAVEALNRTALLALDASGDEGGDGSDGADSQDRGEQMESLAGEQEQVNQEARSLQSDPGADGSEGRMEELSRAQEGIARQMRELAGQPGTEEGAEDLEEMAEEAEALSRELGDGRLDASILERQTGLLERLLDGGRIFEREGPTEEREGTAAQDVERRVVEPLPPGVLGRTGIALPGPEALRELSPAERRMVLEYFERLNRRGGGGSP